MKRLLRKIQKPVTLALLFLVSALPVNAGLLISRSNGIATTGADGILFINTNGIATTGADGLLAFAPNGIATTGADGIATTGADGITFTSSNGIATTGADSMLIKQADGLTLTGVNGVAVTGADGQTYQADAVTIKQASGIATTGADEVIFRGADGIATTGADSFTVERADGIATTGADALNVQHADSVTLSSPDGTVFSISPNGIATTGADNIAITYANGIATTGADGIATTGADGIATTGADEDNSGLQSVDPELAITLDRLTDDSNVNAMIVYHHLPNDADLADLQQLGILGGTRFRKLPVIAVTTTKSNLIAVSHLPAVRSIYSNRTLQSSGDPYLALNRAGRVSSDSDLTLANGGLPVSGRSVTVAVLDTGVDATHADLANQVVQNVKLLDTQSLSVGFTYPSQLENLSNTDQAYGHGTFVAGVIAGNGLRSGGRYAGVAPGARILGLSAGDLTLSFVLAGFDYLLSNGSNYNARVVNCSFSANTVFDFNDPVNIATKMLTDSGVNVVFSAGNTGSGANTMNPYAVAPWVISVGATDGQGHLADFSSRGAFASALFHPTLVAPGVNVISTRALGLTGVLGLAGADVKRLTPGELPYYTTASGTSFSAPQVAATIAMMLEMNPHLRPAAIKEILQRTATSMPQYYQYEVGAGMLNAHAAVLEAAFPQRRMGIWRTVLNRGNVQFINDPAQQFSGSVAPNGSYTSFFNMPENTLLAAVQIAWGPPLSVNDLGLALLDANGAPQAAVNTLNLPGLTGKRERLVVKLPGAGNWQARVNQTSLLSFTSQPFSGTVEVTRAQFAPLNDLGGVNNPADIYQAIRTRVMSAYGNKFRPTKKVTRGALAEALVYGANLPQYLAAQPLYADVRDLTTRNFVESAQYPANTALFPVDGSGYFRPNEAVDRMTAALVLVRAAGLQAQAEAANDQFLELSDWLKIPASLRGYVYVAMTRGLMKAEGYAFNSQNVLTRSELARALVALQRIATE
ncbi:MAG: S8 family serine peptidase [Acidobacteria bacterium]|nr:S8 family serine peptidase [Acidobacteriota bacterium]